MSRHVPSGAVQGIACDLTDQARVVSAVRTIRPDAVIHAAAHANVDQCELAPADAWRANVEATRHVIQAAQETHARFIYVSSDYVFDGQKGAPYDETDPPHPINYYGQTKLAGEAAVQDSGLPWLIIRPSTLFGPGRRSFVDDVVHQVEAGDPVTVFADQVTSPSYTVDVAEGLARLVDMGAEGVVHLANDGAVFRGDFAREVIRAWGSPQAVVREVPLAAAERPARRPRNSALAIGRLQRATRWTPRSWREALCHYLTWKKRSVRRHVLL